MKKQVQYQCYLIDSQWYINEMMTILIIFNEKQAFILMIVMGYFLTNAYGR